MVILLALLLILTAIVIWENNKKISPLLKKMDKEIQSANEKITGKEVEIVDRLYLPDKLPEEQQKIVDEKIMRLYEIGGYDFQVQYGLDDNIVIKYKKLERR